MLKFFSYILMDVALVAGRLHFPKVYDAQDCPKTSMFMIFGFSMMLNPIFANGNSCFVQALLSSPAVF